MIDIEWPPDDQPSSPGKAPHPIPTDWPLAVPAAVAAATAAALALLPLEEPLPYEPFDLAAATLAATVGQLALAIMPGN